MSVRRIGPAASGMTFGKRVRACMPVLIVAAAFFVYAIALNREQPFRIHDDRSVTPQPEWPELWLYAGFSRIRSAGFEISWYDTSKRRPATTTPKPASRSTISDSELFLNREGIRGESGNLPVGPLDRYIHPPK